VKNLEGVIVRDWQRLPKVLVNEYCQKQKRRKPRYVKAKIFPDTLCVGSGHGDPAYFRRRIILPDDKNKDKDLNYATKEGYKSVALAEQYAALLALKSLQGTLPLEQKLPEPFRGVWLSMEEAEKKDTSHNSKSGNTSRSKTSNQKLTSTKSSRFDSVYERKQHQMKQTEERNKKKREREMKKERALSAYSKVHMDAKLRGLIHDLLTAGVQVKRGVKSPSRRKLTNQEKLRTEVLTKYLTEIGFTQGDANDAAKYTKIATDDRFSWETRVHKLPHVKEAIDWLCINIPEDRIPQKYAASGGQFEVVGGVGGWKRKLRRKLVTLGFPEGPAKKAVEGMETEDFDKALRLCLEKINEVIFPDLVTKIASTKGTSTSEESLEMRKDELEALESIFDERLKVTKTRWRVSLNVARHKAEFNILFPEGSQYPKHIPLTYCTFKGNSLKPSQIQQINQGLLRHASENLGDMMVFELVQWLEEEGPKVLANPKNYRFDNMNRLETVSPSTVKERESKSKKVRSHTKRERKEKAIKNDPKKNEQILAHFTERAASSEYKKMLDVRVKLPAYKQRKKIVNEVLNNQVVVISGETGCGKSTQVPQLILDDLIERKLGSTANIVCTQPRRISAVGLGTRVAAERAERVGETVGYQIRLENKTSQMTQLSYVTTGILLRRLTTGGTILGISHVIIDEVHERSVDIDFLMVLLKHLLQVRKDLKLVLMSATLNAQLFAKYFSNAPTLHIPGRTFPVTDYFLEDFLEHSGYNIPRPQWSTFNKKDEEMRFERFKSKTNGEYSQETLKSLARWCENEKHSVDLRVSTACVLHVLKTTDSGAILVFLPGAYEINSMCRKVDEKARDRGLKVKCLPLHSQLTTVMQREVFKRPPYGVRKVVCATNIAETSITIDDVVYVIDSGKHKENQFDPRKKLTQLVECFISRASAKQRQGRAGRVRSGVCYKLYTKECFSDIMRESQLPEIQRVPLEHICLSIKAMQLRSKKKKSKKGDIKKILNSAIEPPTAVAMDSAISEMVSLKALDEETEALTPLGQHLSRLPVGNIRLGKLLVYGALMQCLEPMILVAAALSGKSPWRAPPHEREAANEIRKTWYNGTNCSDHLTTMKVIREFRRIRRYGEKRNFCDNNYLSFSQMQQIDGIVQQYSRDIRDIGFSADASSLNKNSQKYQLMSGVICSALYPNVLNIRLPPKKFVKTIQGSEMKDYSEEDLKDFKFYKFDTDHGYQRVFLHASSMLFRETNFKFPWIYYLESMELSSGGRPKITIFDASMVSPMALLLFGGKITVHADDSLIAVDGWIKFRTSGQIAVYIRMLRERIDEVLLQKIADPSLDLTNNPVINVLNRLIMSDGIESHHT